MAPTLFTLGKLSVPSYTVLLDLGLILALVLTFVEGRRLLGSGESALDVGLWAILGGIAGGRLGFVLANAEVFREEPLRALRVWEGGLAFHGAFLGGLLVAALLAWLVARRQAAAGGGPVLPRVLAVAEALAPGLALGLAFGWAGCLLAGYGYGAIGEGLGYAVLPDATGLEAPRFATQAFGLGLALLLFLLVWLLRGRWPFAGAGFFLLTLLYFAGQFFLGYTRGDETLYVAGWRLGQLIDLGLVLLSAAALLLLWRLAPLPAPDDEPDAASLSLEESGEPG